MPQFNKTSQDRLRTCHEDLQILFNYVVKEFDCKIICGHRTTEQQQELFKQGRQFINGEWTIKDPGQIVTYKDGVISLSKHNRFPSVAVDVVPYPLEWENVNRMRYFIGYVKGVARVLKDKGKMNYELITGIDWDNDTILKDQRFNDFPHFQLK